MLWLPVMVPLASLVDALGLGPLFLPGQVAGYGVAAAAEAALVARWERRHGRRLVSGVDGDGDVRLYATRPASEEAGRDGRDQAAGAAASPTGTTSAPPAARRSGS